jgi:hypothetical protein
MSVDKKYTINLNSNLFEQTVNSLIKKKNIEEIIETGTFNGLGSTTVFAKTKKRTISIECSYEHYQQAKMNLKHFNNVELYYGTSLPIEDMITFIENDDIYESDEFISHSLMGDYANHNVDIIKQAYKEEVSSSCSCNKSCSSGMENLLIKLIDNDKKQLVFLDSAGGVGYLEFKKFMSLDKNKLKNKILLLDDISHVKHYRSVLWLQKNEYDIVISEDERFAFCIFS